MNDDNASKVSSFLLKYYYTSLLFLSNEYTQNLSWKLKAENSPEAENSLVAGNRIAAVEMGGGGKGAPLETISIILLCLQLE